MNITIAATQVRPNDTIVATNGRVQWVSQDPTSVRNPRVLIHTTNGEFDLLASASVNVIRNA